MKKSTGCLRWLSGELASCADFVWLHTVVHAKRKFTNDVATYVCEGKFDAMYDAEDH